MIWTYRVFRDSQGRYSIREVFYHRESRMIIDYSKAPVAVVGSSVEELMQLVQWFKEAFDLPVLSLEEVDAEMAKQPVQQQRDRSKNISLKQVLAELTTETEGLSGNQ
ncbi:hypothetical protein [Microseira sp. BLCC-F43]|jgi:hypothetical protein|uniref:hypothetical protein n=1 Tax=Microseira sp. BLCC-F43 TaxID=3153602 RepID=UPI0035BB61B7